MKKPGLTGLPIMILALSLILFHQCVRERSGGQETPPSREYRTFRIMPLGNSITYGNYHPENRPEGLITGYRQALWLMLNEAGYHVDFVGSRRTGADAEPSFDPDNEGYPGWTDDQIGANVYKWLRKNPADIILLHIGTNGLDPDPTDVEGILDEIDRFEADYSNPIKVILAKIINRSTYSQLTTQFNQNIEKLALDRVMNDGDDIMVIDMEFETGIDYRLRSEGGEMFDNLHPFEGGHEKMAVRWFEALKEVLPWPDQEPMTVSEPEVYSSMTDMDARVSEHLLALYEFTEREGNLVHDVSGVGIPQDLYINDETSVLWDSLQGLEIIREAILLPSDMNRKIVDSCMVSDAITLEAWIRTGYVEQGGPADMVRISNPMEKGISISQDHTGPGGARYYFTSFDSQGESEGKAFGSIALQHLAYTKDRYGTESFYVNGEPAGTGKREHSFTEWNRNTFKLSLCNSLSFGNPWHGKLFLVAVYSKAFSPEEVEHNYMAGIEKDLSGHPVPPRPGSLEAKAVSTVACRLTWEDPSTEETGFILERKSKDGDFHYIASLPANSTKYVDEGLEAGGVYRYRIESLNDVGQSGFSNESEARTFPDNDLANVALHKPALQSSVSYRGDASRGVDGNRDGAYGGKSVTHTEYELNAWWEVDLQETCYIDHLKVWNRTDLCCRDRLARYYIFISEEPFESRDFQSTLIQPGVRAIYQEFFPDPMVVLNVAGRGRYIRLQLSDSQNINLAELEVMGKSVMD